MAVDRRAARLGVLAIVGVLLFGLIGVRLWFLQTVRAEELQERVTEGKRRGVVLLPERGRIFDAEGRILADNERVLTVAVDYQMLRKKADRDEIFRRLSGWIDVPIEDMEARYQSDRYSPFLPMPVKEDVTESTALAILERSEDFPGVEILQESRRVYPYAPHAAHVVGYMGAITEDQLETYLDAGYEMNERVGQFGVELSLENLLHGTPGRQVWEVDASNRPIRLIEEVPPVNGFDIQLTIDLDIQQYAEQALETTLEMRRGVLAPNPEVVQPDGSMKRMDPTQPEEVPFKAPAGSTVVMDYDTGQVIALASYPTFDNRWFEAGLSGEKFKEIFPVTDDPDQSILVNRAVQGRYNLGSTFKPFTAYAALATGLISPVEYYRDEGTYRMHSVNQDRCDAGLVRCVYKNANCGNGRPCVYGPVNVTDALAISSDTFFYRVGENIMFNNGGAPVLQEQVELFGFGADTGIDLPFEFDGTVPDAELKKRYAEDGIISEDEGRDYFTGDNVQLAIGQGLLSATPLQLANAYAALANQGFLYEPQIVKAVWQPGVPDGTEAGFVDFSQGKLHESYEEPTLIRQIPMDEGIWQPIVQGLERVVTTGAGVESDFYHFTTGEKLFHDYPDSAIPVAGKTGTAQGRLNLPWNDSSVFTAFSRDPERSYVVTSYLEKSGYGSQAAAPVVKCTFLALSGVTPTDPVVLSDPLDLDSTVAAPSQELADTSCYNTRFGVGLQAQE